MNKNFIEYFNLYTAEIGKIKNKDKSFNSNDLYLRKFYYSDNASWQLTVILKRETNDNSKQFISR
jgi:recombination DNA repair RAD52 pathway protein